MSIAIVLLFIVYVVLFPGQIIVRLIILITKKKSLYHIKISALEFCGLALIYILAFQNFGGYYHEKHIANRNLSMTILILGFFAYFVNNLLIEKKRKRMEILLMIFMGIALLYSLFSILELLFQNEFELVKMVLLQLPYSLLMVFGLIIYKYRPSLPLSESEHAQF